MKTVKPIGTEEVAAEAQCRLACSQPQRLPPHLRPASEHEQQQMRQALAMVNSIAQETGAEPLALCLPLGKTWAEIDAKVKRYKPHRLHQELRRLTGWITCWYLVPLSVLHPALPGTPAEQADYSLVMDEWGRPCAPARYVLHYLLAFRGMASLSRLTKRWQAAQERAASILQRTAQLECAPVWPRSVRGQWSADDFSAHELHSLEHLSEEGLSMHHCAAIYAPACAAGEMVIFSLRRAGKRVSTLAVTRQGDEISLYQHHARYNAAPPPEVRRAAAQFLPWLNQAGRLHPPRSLPGPPSPLQKVELAQEEMESNTAAMLKPLFSRLLWEAASSPHGKKPPLDGLTVEEVWQQTFKQLLADERRVQLHTAYDEYVAMEVE